MKKQIQYDCEKHIFEYMGRTATVLLPKDKDINNKWVWKAEFFGAFDYTEQALLKDGWYIVHYDVKDMYGCDEAIRLMKKFHSYITKQYALCKKATIFGFSRGGLYSVNYALTYPKDVGALYLDAPVLDVKSWPAGCGDGEGDEKCWEECKNCYNITEETAKDFDKNPIDRADELIQTNIPLILVCGDSDTVVPFCENGEKLAKKYEENNVKKFKLIVKNGVGHHPHSLEDPTEIVDFIKENIL